MPEETDGDGGKALYTAAQARAAKLLRAVREEAGLTQTEVAVRLHRPLGFIHRMESGQQRIGIVEWLWVCRACRADPVEFLTRMADAFEPPLELSLGPGRPRTPRR